jgi:hypothetical protein
MSALTYCAAAFEIVVNGSKGPFTSIDKKGGNRTFAAGALRQLFPKKAAIESMFLKL